MGGHGSGSLLAAPGAARMPGRGRRVRRQARVCTGRAERRERMSITKDPQDAGRVPIGHRVRCCDNDRVRSKAGRVWRKGANRLRGRSPERRIIQGGRMKGSLDVARVYLGFRVAVAKKSGGAR